MSRELSLPVVLAYTIKLHYQREDIVDMQRAYSLLWLRWGGAR